MLMVERPEGKRLLGRSRHSWVNIKLDLGEINGVVTNELVWFRTGTTRTLAIQ
jgi:hypothetical protein